jgi:hypothetical protein
VNYLIFANTEVICARVFQFFFFIHQDFPACSVSVFLFLTLPLLDELANSILFNLLSELSYQLVTQCLPPLLEHKCAQDYSIIKKLFQTCFLH